MITNFTPDDDHAADVAIQTNGRIVAAGSTGFNGAVARFALARYHPDGTLDPTFSDNGKVITKFSPGFDLTRGVAIQADGKIVAAGSTYPDVNGLDGRFAPRSLPGREVEGCIEPTEVLVSSSITNAVQ